MRCPSCYLLAAALAMFVWQSSWRRLAAATVPALAAVIARRVIQSTPVSFGAAGTPILVGINTGLSADPLIAEFSRQQRYADWLGVLIVGGGRVAFLPAIAGMLRVWWK